MEASVACPDEDIQGRMTPIEPGQREEPTAEWKCDQDKNDDNEAVENVEQLARDEEIQGAPGGRGRRGPLTVMAQTASPPQSAGPQLEHQEHQASGRGAPRKHPRGDA